MDVDNLKISRSSLPLTRIISLVNRIPHPVLKRQRNQSQRDSRDVEALPSAPLPPMQSVVMPRRRNIVADFEGTGLGLGLGLVRLREKREGIECGWKGNEIKVEEAELDLGAPKLLRQVDGCFMVWISLGLLMLHFFSAFIYRTMKDGTTDKLDRARIEEGQRMPKTQPLRSEALGKRLGLHFIPSHTYIRVRVKNALVR
ncbi:hypothetical protein BU17DRAFT_103057 [Hysterangium stoloniferum]|nr:hypothetical protein BU17DRAFT_103057 [Hysterangium stoloniferum]